MLIVGIKATHDGCVAIVQDGVLVCSYEAEKIGNGRRHSPLRSLDTVADILAEYGHDPADVDAFVVDGWIGADHARGATVLRASDAPAAAGLAVASYQPDPTGDALTRRESRGLVVRGSRYSFSSYAHVAGHIACAYATSPFAARGERAAVLVWDGATTPRLFRVDPGRFGAQPVAELFDIVGAVYPAFAAQFPPFGPPHEGIDWMALPGKVMAFGGLGVARPELVAELRRIDETRRRPAIYEPFGPELRRRGILRGVPSADVLASFERFLGDRLVESIQNAGVDEKNLCFAGGCGLNINWNRALRDCGVFDTVWVPPVANDSGSAIGAAAAEWWRRSGEPSLEWSVFAGPPLRAGRMSADWARRPVKPEELARLLTTGEPVLFLDGRAECGPRALGARSIIAAATDPAAKDALNQLKGREPYRPVAPVCLEERAARIFDPGHRDPYMLFNHNVRPEWRDRVPAIVHADGTARLQTVSDRDHPNLAALLREYERLTGIPVLCNTSANSHGCGFFPDLVSAAAWGRVPRIWSDGYLYETTCTAVSVHTTKGTVVA